MLLPIFVLMMILTVDLGRMVFTQMALQEATYTAARAGAQVGGTNVGGADTSRKVLIQSLQNSPGISYAAVNQGSIQVSPAQCSVSNPLVTVSVSYNFTWSVPGMYTLLRVAAPNFAVKAVAVSRCEIIR